MLGVMMLLSYSFPLAAALTIRRYFWIGVCALLAAIVATPVLYKVATASHDPMGWGFAMVLVFLPALLGTAIGSAINAVLRWRMGPGQLTAWNVIPAALLSAISVWFGLWVAIDF